MRRIQSEEMPAILLARMAVGTGRLWFSSVAAQRPPDNASFKVFQERVHALEGEPILIVHSPKQMRALSPRRVYRWHDAIELEPGETANYGALAWQLYITDDCTFHLECCA